jgi:hypothetical protein
MKSRIVFTLIMAAFFNPISVMAAMDQTKIACNAWADEHAKDNAIAKEQAKQDGAEVSGVKKKSGDAG